jgi:hypothetical protein
MIRSAAHKQRQPLGAWMPGFVIEDGPAPESAVAAAVKYGVVTDKDRAIAGGLQEHSVGSTYPFHPVGIGNAESTDWEVHDLMRGTRFWPLGTKPWRTVSCAVALAVADMAKRGIFSKEAFR